MSHGVASRPRGTYVEGSDFVQQLPSKQLNVLRGGDPYLHPVAIDGQHSDDDAIPYMDSLSRPSGED